MYLSHYILPEPGARKDISMMPFIFFACISWPHSWRAHIWWSSCSVREDPCVCHRQTPGVLFLVPFSLLELYTSNTALRFSQDPFFTFSPRLSLLNFPKKLISPIFCVLDGSSTHSPKGWLIRSTVRPPRVCSKVQRETRCIWRRNRKSISAECEKNSFNI